MNSAQSDFDYLLKLLLIGNSSVGKSSLLCRYCDNAWNDSFTPTIGVDFKIKSLDVDNKNVKMQIWDTAGQERFKNITSSYYRGAVGIMVVYDITCLDSFQNINTWLIEIEKHANKNVYKVLIGNKCDLDEKRQVSYEQAKEFADSHGMKFIETSAKTNSNVSDAFTIMAKEIISIQSDKGKKLKESDDKKEKAKLDLSKSSQSIKNKKECCK